MISYDKVFPVTKQYKILQRVKEHRHPVLVGPVPLNFSSNTQQFKGTGPTKTGNLCSFTLHMILYCLVAVTLCHMRSFL